MNKLTAEKCRNKIALWERHEEAHCLPMSTELHLQAYRIALPILEQQERGEGEWIEWAGGECPIPLCEVIDVRWRAGGTMTVIAGERIWTHDGTFDDIIAYRIIPERATNQNGEQ